MEKPFAFYCVAFALITISVVFLIGMIIGLNKIKRDMLQANLDDRDRVMRTISTEIHDNASQLLTAAMMNLKSVVAADPHSRQLLNTGNKILGVLTRELQYISHSSDNNFVRQRRLLRVLDDICDWVNVTKTLSCRVEMTGRKANLDSVKELMIVRIVQEAVNNAIKHAKAKNLLIRIVYRTVDMEVCVVDDGTGFEINDTPRDGIGLLSMKQRAGMIKAKIEVTSTAEKGTEVCVIVPL